MVSPRVSKGIEVRGWLQSERESERAYSDMCVSKRDSKGGREGETSRDWKKIEEERDESRAQERASERERNKSSKREKRVDRKSEG